MKPLRPTIKLQQRLELALGAEGFFLRSIVQTAGSTSKLSVDLIFGGTVGGRWGALRKFSDEKIRKNFAASVISSVIALAKLENGRERKKTNERIGKR